jgi:hypothetical protein
LKLSVIAMDSANEWLAENDGPESGKPDGFSSWLTALVSLGKRWARIGWVVRVCR